MFLRTGRWTECVLGTRGRGAFSNFSIKAGTILTPFLTIYCSKIHNNQTLILNNNNQAITGEVRMVVIIWEVRGCWEGVRMQARRYRLRMSVVSNFALLIEGNSMGRGSLEIGTSSTRRWWSRPTLITTPEPTSTRINNNTNATSAQCCFSRSGKTSTWLLVRATRILYWERRLFSWSRRISSSRGLLRMSISRWRSFITSCWWSNRRGSIWLASWSGRLGSWWRIINKGVTMVGLAAVGVISNHHC